MDGKLEYLITADASKLISEIGSSLSALGSLSAKIAGMGTLAGLGAMGAGIGIGTKIAADRESVKIAFKNIIGDAKEADAVLAQLFKYADSTPFQIDEIVAAAKVLAASGFQAKELGSEIAALGNIAAATGGDLKSLAIVYGQVASAGKLMGQDMLQFINQGAGEVKAQIARTMGVSKEELAGLQEQGAITFDILKKSVHDLAGEQGKWGNTTKELAASTAGLFSTMEDAIKGALNELGKPINDAIKPVLTSATKLAEDLKPIMADLGNSVASMVTNLHQFVMEASSGGSLAKNLVNSVRDAFAAVGDYMEPVKNAFMTMASGFGKAIMQSLEPFGTALGNLFASMPAMLSPFANALLETFERAGHLMAAMLYDVMSHLPGMSGLAKQADTERYAANKAGERASGWMDDATEAAAKALIEFEDDVSKAGKGFDAAMETMVEAAKSARDQLANAPERAKAKALEREAQNKTVNDPEAEKRKADEKLQELQKAAAAETRKQVEALNNNARISGKGHFQPKEGVSPFAGLPVPDKSDKDKENTTDKLKKEETAKEAVDEGNRRSAEEDKRKAEADARDAQAANQRAAADNANLRNTRGAEREMRGRIQGWSQARENSGEYARNRWERLNGAEKQRYGNNAANYARGHSTRLDDIESNNGWNWGGKRMAASMLTRANQAVAGGMGAVPAQPHQRPAAPPIAQTQDSTSRVLLQNILAQLKQMSTHLGNLTKG